MLAIAAMPHAQDARAAVQGHAADGLSGQQGAQKKRKRAQSGASAGTGAPEAKAAVSGLDSSQHLPFVQLHCTLVSTVAPFSPLDKLHFARRQRNVHNVRYVNASGICLTPQACCLRLPELKLGSCIRR